ncbi:MAG: exodeoxyribonuclease VII large subunit, partial [Gammaproteobacteria bacterium]|nr:exodeoxyribonuclease VII large subunit [Gammaproteobacteria bacterium]
MCVTGEISNLVKASSGHCYFTLKDSKAQVRCACFSGAQRKLSMENLSNGQQVLVYGKITLYEPRGDYQLIVSHLQDTGIGLLYQQYLQLKNKLEQQGLFSPELKKTIPLFPQHIAIITSATGAVIHDIMTTLQRRYPLAIPKLYRSEVQGIDAPRQLISALGAIELDARADVIILGRGGGSIEDLWAFNDEKLAHAILECKIPIITGIGHETDFTIADFVADYRAATPTAAAEKATPNQIELMQHLKHWQARLLQLMTKKIEQHQKAIEWIYRQLASPEKLLIIPWQRLDFSTRSLHDYINVYFNQKQNQLIWLTKHLHTYNPSYQLQLNRERHSNLISRLQRAIARYIELKSQHIGGLINTFNAIGPQATLQRGYAIATFEDNILTDS